MQPTLEPGDYILVSKISYGPRVMHWWKLLFDKTIEYNWYSGLGEIKKGDVFVFNLPKLKTLKDKYPDIYGWPVVKRCIGVPGDTVIINNEGNEKNERNEGNENTKKNENNERNERNERNENKKVNGFTLHYEIGIAPDLYPYDSTLNWRIDNYGPLWVPGKGKPLKLSPATARHYRDVLLYEGMDAVIVNDSVFLNGKYFSEYVFRYNYYFMNGDNFYNSSDSRYWGFVPQTHVIGKAVLVLYSLDPHKQWYKSFKWNRFLKRI
jgi:signal peptidase I